MENKISFFLFPYLSILFKANVALAFKIMVRFSSCDFLFFIKDFERKKEPIKGGTTRKDGNSFEEEINVGKYVI